MAIDFEIIKGFLKGIRPVPMLTVTEWADTHRYLTSESAAEPGPWKTSRVPYLKEIMDCLSPNSPVTELISVKGVQLGYTEGGLNVVGCFMDIDPCSIMYVMPTIETAQEISKSRIDPMIDNCPSLYEKIGKKTQKDGGNTILKKRFPGGVLSLSGANSAASLRSKPVRVLVLDEVDAYPLDVEGEGSPISLAEKRTSTFGASKKIYKLSTPTTESESVIQPLYETTEQRKYFVPCPHCGHMQHLVFANLQWKAGEYESVRYYCEDCGAGIEERHKTQMLAAGEWRATVPEMERPTRRGYHINSLYSPLGWLSWSDIAFEYEDAEKSKDDNKLKTFTNTILGETWKEKGDSPEWQNLYNRRERYALNRPPKDVAFLTAGVDVQGNRLEVEIVGWCLGKRSYSIDYRVLPGDTASKAVWDELAKVLDEQWEREDGVLMPLRLMAVDSGYRTTDVYAFCERYDHTRVIPTKGQENQQVIFTAPRATAVTRAGKKVGKTRVWNVGINIIKSELYGWLRQEKTDGVAPAGYCHFPEYDEHFFKMLTAERIQTKLVRGYPRTEWVKKYERNEALDCRVYARAAAAVVGLDRMREEHFKEISESYMDSQPKTTEKRERRRSSFW